VDKSVNVLVVEDNPNLRKVLVNIVKKIGFAGISEAEDGQQAWEMLEQDKIGLVLADWNMPRMNGLELLQKMRETNTGVSDIPFLMITAADTKQSIMTAGKYGVDAYIIKPFSVNTISEKIEEAMSKRAAS